MELFTQVLETSTHYLSLNKTFWCSYVVSPIYKAGGCRLLCFGNIFCSFTNSKTGKSGVFLLAAAFWHKKKMKCISSIILSSTQAVLGRRFISWLKKPMQLRAGSNQHWKTFWNSDKYFSGLRYQLWRAIHADVRQSSSFQKQIKTFHEVRTQVTTSYQTFIFSLL